MKKKKIILLVLGIVLVTLSILIFTNINNRSSAPDFSQYYRGNYTEAYKKLLPAAQKGDAIAQVSLGNLYSAGLGVKQNYKKAYFWYKKAESQNNIDAMINLAVMYKNGYYVKKNIDIAINLYEKVINLNNDSNALFNLSTIYLYDKKDNKVGLKLLEESSKLGNSTAQSQLGLIYYLGEYNLPINYQQAITLLKKSATAGNSSGQNNLAVAYYQGKAIKKNDFKAYFWFYIASNFGNNSKSKELINAYSFNLTDSQKQQAVNKAEKWVKNHKEINSSLMTANTK
jgi:uncharacterized protein